MDENGIYNEGATGVINCNNLLVDSPCDTKGSDF